MAPTQKAKKNALNIFELRSSAGPVVKVGTEIEYSIHQVTSTFISTGSRYSFEWAVENDPTSVDQSNPATRVGPRDARMWKLRASRVGTHHIKVTVRLKSPNNKESLIEQLSLTQIVTDDGRSLLHQEIIDKASKPVVDKKVREWTTLDLAKWKVGDSNYIHEFKTQWVRGYREVIKAAAKQFDLPDLLLAGVAYAEVGGDPSWIDNIAYSVRSFDHAADPVLEPVTVTKKPELTSFGNLSTQVRRAAESLGYDPTRITSEQRGMIVDSLKNPRENIFIAAKHLAELRDIDFKGKGASSMTLDDMKVTATRFNRGPDLNLAAIKKNLGYGESITKRAVKISGMLK